MRKRLTTRLRAADDRGTAMLMTMSMMMLVTTVAGLATTLAVHDLRGAGQAQQAGTALDAAEAGIAQAVSYIRTHGTRSVACNLTTCPANPWSPANPAAADLKGGAQWSGSIRPVARVVAAGLLTATTFDAAAT